MCAGAGGPFVLALVREARLYVCVCAGAGYGEPISIGPGTHFPWAEGLTEIN